MKKIALLGLIFSSFAVLGQSLELSGLPNTVVVDTKVEISQGALAIKNTSADTLSVRVSREILNEVSGTSNYFCWDLCYPPSVDSSGSLTIMPDSTSNSFIADYDHQSMVGTTSIKYCFYNANDVSDSVCTIVNFANEVMSVPEEAFLNNFNLMPNPAINNVTVSFGFNYFGNTSFTIYDILGNEVIASELNGTFGSKTFNTSKLQAGVYFYSIKANGDVLKTARLVIAK